MTMGHTPRKRFGQNFLRDDSVIQEIARAIAPTADDHLVEIGPGEGALTEALATSGCQLDAIELDRDLRVRLLASFSSYPRFALHSADALTLDYPALIDGDEKLRVVGNLPYNISTPLIFRLLEHAPIIADMHFMLQREVVERLAAVPNTKAWGRLGVMAQFQCEVEHLFDVPPEAFYPPPKVQSAIVRLTPHTNNPWPDCDRGLLAKVVTQAFGQRRKTLRNNFKGSADDAALTAAGLDPGARAESLSIEQFIALALRIDSTQLLKAP
jgi:16S rRNA (adenine1518-N6/adenine1519-N6)-dimethyltransferase